MASPSFRCTAPAVAAAIAVTFVIGPAPRAQVSSQGLIQAPGGPIVDCVGGPARVIRLEGVIAEQRRMLDRTRELLRKAEAGHAEATEATEEAILEQAKDFAKDQVTLIRTVRAMREAGLSAEQRRRILTLTERIQETVEQINDAKDRGQMLSALTRNTSDWQSLMSVLDESGLGDEAASALSSAFGPVGPAVVKGLIIARDLLYVGIQQRISDQELAQARHNNAVLENAVRLQQDRIDRLRELMADNCHNAGQQPEQSSSPRPIPPEGVVGPAAAPPPPPGAAPAGAAGVKKGPGKLVPWAIGLAAAGGATYWASTKLAELDTTGDGSGTGSSIRFVRSTPIQCQPVGGSSLQSICKGSVTLDVGSVLSAGTQVCIRTDPSGFAACQLRASSSELTLGIDERIIGCRPTQTGIFVYRDRPEGTPVAPRVTASIPVSCS